jgi:pilus assembly protein TadC
MRTETPAFAVRSRRRAWAMAGWCVATGAPGGVAGLVVAGAWWGTAVGLAIGVACGWWLAHQPSAADRAIRRQFDADLPFAVDLVAAALRAGAAPGAALRAVADAVGGPVSLRFGRVERALRLGAPAAEAWSYLGDVDGAIRVARAAERSDHSGAALAGALVRIADDLRTDSALASEAAARRAGVLVVLPLGLCFLPAFMLTGLVPVIVAVIGGVLSASP